MQNVYIVKPGRMRRQHNTLRFEYEEGGHKYFPIEQTDSLFVMVPLELNTKLLEFLSQHKIPLHIFNYYGFYSGSFMPREKLVTGPVLVQQAVHSDSDEKRIIIAQEILKGASANLLKNVRQFVRDGLIKEDQPLIDELKNRQSEISETQTIEELMGIEGSMRRSYYKLVDGVIMQRSTEFVMNKRVKRPPNNKMNSLISFVNSLLYASVLNEIYHTHLNASISYLHEPQDRRYSLALDLSEVFKPLLSDRLIFRLVNLNMLSNNCFDEVENVCYLNDKGRKIVLTEYHKKLNTKIQHRILKRKVSYQRLIRLECYKLVKHLLGEKKYTSFKMWW
ncbi:subtype I-B CRISPR-associated endonuclease Cas1 [Natranaerobius trueperi]|uniref:CRISPR-associated endonuclease Cas1 n=2 Tax=Natranaerobius trueperi TaxID=759412 RepID=A0A226BY96_9FIRM|nr:subtype I-B CRISPR-associated endonuclease Cas1 [Natranaerobius trueperi]